MTSAEVARAHLHQDGARFWGGRLLALRDALGRCATDEAREHYRTQIALAEELRAHHAARGDRRGADGGGV